jgi:lipoprotein-releasing system ATP-binding protein
MIDPREVLVELQQVTKAFGSDPRTRTEVLHGIDLELRAGELVAMVGPSGSGKSTLLNLLGLLDRPTSGALRVRGTNVSELSEQALTRLRGETLGFIFQFHHMLPGLSVVENVMLPAASLEGRLHPRQRPRAEWLLEQVGLSGQADRLARQLSGGMQQRVAIARALMNNPALVYADEPTGNLDTATSDTVIALLQQWNKEHGTAFLIVTHDPSVARRCRRVLTLVDGRLVRDGPPDGGAD